MKKSFHAFLLLLSAAPLPVLAQGSADALKNLEAAIKKESESRPAATGPAQGYPGRSAPGRVAFAQIQAAIAKGETRQTEERLPQLAMYFASDEVHQQILKLGAALREERAAKQNAYVAEINAAVNQASDAVHRAKSAEELDAPLKNLSQFRDQGGSDHISDAEQSALRKVEPAITFLKHWQDYLAAQKSGSSERARQSLRDLATYGTSGFIPRSQVLAELQKYLSERESTEPPPPGQVDQIVEKAKSLDQVAEAMKQLQKIQRHSGHLNAEVTATLMVLVSIERTYREFQAGLPTKLEAWSTQTPDRTSPAVTPLKVQLLLLVLPRYLDVPADLNPQPRETVQAYLQRIVDQARARADSALMTRARDAQRFFATGYNPFSIDMATTFMTAAKNQEAAGQYMLAVVSYQNVLRNGGEAAPAKLIGEKLAALKAAHPQEYDEGMKIFLNADYPRLFPKVGSTKDHVETPPAALPIPPAATGSPTAPPRTAASATPSTTPR